MKLETAEIFRIRPESRNVEEVLIKAYCDGEVIKMGGSSFVVVGHDCVTFVLQAVKCAVPAAWTGEGLPPAGTDCEHRTGHGMSWTLTTVLAHGKHKVFYRDSNGHEWTRLYDEIEFRPIRTPEQVAEEEARQAAVKVIENRIMARMGDLNVRNLAEDLHALLQEMAVKP